MSYAVLGREDWLEVDQAKWTIEFWQNAQGRKPVLDWIKGDLTKGKRFALGKAMQHVL